jgi:hypothetical protein
MPEERGATDKVSAKDRAFPIGPKNIDNSCCPALDMRWFCLFPILGPGWARLERVAQILI